jgi:hypothetical protein
MSVLRSVFIGVIGVMVLLALVVLWSSWSMDEFTTFRTAFRGGVNPPSKFVCYTHFSADASKDTMGWRCDALNALCRHGAQSACMRVAAYKPDAEILAPPLPTSSLVPDSAEKALSRLVPDRKDGASVGIMPKVVRTINDIPHVSAGQLAPGHSDAPPAEATPKSSAGTGP